MPVWILQLFPQDRNDAWWETVMGYESFWLSSYRKPQPLVKVRSLTQLGTTLSVGVIDLEDLILNYNQNTSGERVIGVKKRRIGGVRTPLSLAPYPSAPHNSSPLLEVNVARRKRQTREVHAARKEEQPRRRNDCMVCLEGQNQKQLQKKCWVFTRYGLEWLTLCLIEV